LPPELLLLAQICTKSFVGWDFAPDPTGGVYSSPRPASKFKVKGMRGRREGRESQKKKKKSAQIQSWQA